jgi:hypothetical protein
MKYAIRSRLLLGCLTVAMVLGVALHVTGSVAKAVPTYAPAVWQQCNVSEVSVIQQERVRIACTPAVGGFSFFAVPLHNAEFASQALSLGTTAIVHNKRINVRFEPGDRATGPTFGCNVADCRPLTGIALVK